MKNARGHVVATSRPSTTAPNLPGRGAPRVRGTRLQDKYPLPAGAYRLRYTVWDLAGNPGRAKAVTVHVSDKPLVEATGSIVAPPTIGWTAPAARPVADDPQPVPCGTVVPSEVYPEPGAMSFRSSDTCGGTWSAERRRRPAATSPGHADAAGRAAGPVVHVAGDARQADGDRGERHRSAVRRWIGYSLTQAVLSLGPVPVRR